MTDDERTALDELKQAATHKIRVADSVYGIIELRNGRLRYGDVYRLPILTNSERNSK